MYIYLMRHGQTDWNKGLKMQGRSDIPLNETGLQQARDAAAGMRGIRFDRIFSSPLQRAAVTAGIVAEGRAIPVEVDERLTELAFGRYEGLYRPEHPEVEVIFRNPASYIPPEGGESYQELDVRCEAILHDLLAPLEDTCENVLVCAHGGLFKGIVRHLLNRPLSEFWSDPPQANCSCTIVECRDGRFTLLEQGRVF